MENERKLQGLKNLSNKIEANIDWLKDGSVGQNTINSISRLMEAKMWIDKDIEVLSKKKGK